MKMKDPTSNVILKHSKHLMVLLLLLSSAVTQRIMARQVGVGEIKGIIIDENGEVLPYASVWVKKLTAERELVKGGFSDEKGCFRIHPIDKGHYLLEISMVGYKSFEKDLFVEGTVDLSTLSLIPDANMLGEVVITAQNKVLDRKSDRFVLDVNASSFQNSNLLEIFTATPFMQVKGEDVTINGKRNILVLIDNVPVPGSTLKQVLHTMNGNEIDKIDFITNPSARYDASVDAVINIKTKRGLQEGWRGSLNGMYSKGDYGRGNIGLNLTYRKSKWTIDARYSFFRNNIMSSIDNIRFFSLTNRNLSVDEHEDQLYKNKLHNAKLSLGYALNDRHQFTLISNVIRNTSPDVDMVGVSKFSDDLSGPVDSVLFRAQDRRIQGTVQNYSLNYLGKLDTLGKQVEFIATYTPLSNDVFTQMRYQEIRLTDGTLLTNLPIVRNSNPGNAHIFVLQSDWTLPFNSAWSVDAGFKFNSSRNRTETNQSELKNGQWEGLPDFFFINNFKEDVLAGYAEVQRDFANTTIRAGLRVEHTEMEVEDVYIRKFFDLFPNLSIQKAFDNRKVTLSYRRSIGRPGFGQLTPFRTYVNEFSISEGNMNLRPKYSNQLVLNGDVTSDLFLELAYMREKDLVMQLPRQEGDVTIYAPVNMNGSDLSVNLSYSKKVISWWDADIYIRGFRYAYDGSLNNDYLREDGYSYNFGVTSGFRLPAGFNIDASYTYYAKAGYGGWRDLSSNFARLAAKKSFLANRLQAVLSFNDIFKGQRYRSDMTAGNLYVYNINYQDTRRVSLGLLFNFGKRTVKVEGVKKMGNEDVINRAN